MYMPKVSKLRNTAHAHRGHSKQRKGKGLENSTDLLSTFQPLSKCAGFETVFLPADPITDNPVVYL